MAMITTASIRKQLEPGLNAVFGDQYKSYPPQWKEIYSTENSKKWKEEDVAMSGLGYAQTRQEGEGILYDELGELWTAVYVHREIVHGYKITRRAVEDGLYESVAKRAARSMARSFAQTKEVLAAEPLNNGFSAYQTGDGVALFATTHPMMGGTWANRPTNSEGLNETTLESALTAIEGFTDYRGLPIMTKGIKLFIPRQLRWTAQRLLETKGRVDTADNTINTMEGIMPFSVNQFFTSTTAWYIKTDVPDGAKHFLRVPLEMGMEGEFDTDTMKYKGRTRYSFGVSDPHVFYASPGV